MKELIYAGIGLACIPAIRAALKAYRAKKAVGDIVADAVEAAVDAVDHKEWRRKVSSLSTLQALALSEAWLGTSLLIYCLKLSDLIRVSMRFTIYS